MKTNWFENNKFLWWFAGEDPYILSECKKEIRIKFSYIGLTVILILIFSTVSISYGVFELLESYYFGLFIGIYVAILVLFLYLFMLYTLTKDVLPPKVKSKYGMYSSLAIRVGFLVVLGIVVSQPIEYKLFSNRINNELNNEIKKEVEVRNIKLNNEYVLKLKDLKDLNIKEDILSKEVSRFNKEKEGKLKSFIEYQYSRNFFIRKLILMDSSKSTWFIWIFSLLFIALFITPVFLKRRIGKNTKYYKYKEQIQRKLVLDHHTAFVNSYNDILKKRYETFNLKWESKYLDPPFCAFKAKDYNLKDDIDFNKWLLDESI